MKTSYLKVMFTWTIVGQLLYVRITSAQFYWLRYMIVSWKYLYTQNSEIRKPYRWRGSLITVNHQMNNDVPYINEIGMAIPCSLKFEREAPGWTDSKGIWIIMKTTFRTCDLHGENKLNDFYLHDEVFLMGRTALMNHDKRWWIPSSPWAYLHDSWYRVLLWQVIRSGRSLYITPTSSPASGSRRVVTICVDLIINFCQRCSILSPLFWCSKTWEET